MEIREFMCNFDKNIYDCSIIDFIGGIIFIVIPAIFGFFFITYIINKIIEKWKKQ